MNITNALLWIVFATVFVTKRVASTNHFRVWR